MLPTDVFLAKVVTDAGVKEYTAHYLDVCEKSFENAKQTKEVNLTDWLDAPWHGFFKVRLKQLA